MLGSSQSSASHPVARPGSCSPDTEITPQLNNIGLDICPWQSHRKQSHKGVVIVKEVSRVPGKAALTQQLPVAPRHISWDQVDLEEVEG